VVKVHVIFERVDQTNM